MGCPANLKGHEHRLTREDRVKGGQSRSVAKVNAVRINTLKHGKYAQLSWNTSKITYCSGCMYQQVCEYYELGSHCKVTIRQIKELNKLGLDLSVKQMAVNCIQSLQRFMKLLLEKTDEKADFMQQLSELNKKIEKQEKELETITDREELRICRSMLEKQYDYRTFLSKGIKSNWQELIETEIDFFKMMVEFKRMVFGNRIIVESPPNTNVIKEEIKAAYELFRKDSDGNIDNFLV